MANEENNEEIVGLGALSCKTLAAIVEAGEAGGELSYEAKAAFAELSRRSDDLLR